MRIFKKLKEKIDQVEKREKPKQIIEKDKRKQTIALTYAIFFCILFCSIGSFVFSLQSANPSSGTSHKKETLPTTINYSAVQSFLNPFVDTYIQVSNISEKNEERKKTLQNYMVTSPDYANSFSVESSDGERILKQKDLYSIKETKPNTLLAQYKVTYNNRTYTEKEISKKEGKKVVKQKVKEPKDEQKTALLNIEIVQKSDAYAVNALPYFTDVYSLKEAMDKADDMAYMMKEPEGLSNSLTFDRIDKYELYQKSGKILANAQVVFLEPETKINVVEDFTITLTKKDSHYYVEKLAHK
ncbi:TPA: conjugal transfer protein [Listeria monocytogenes]|uniref:conjugal transfer protein n=1 Tax=Listeria monocytogenes TaxID=1639 RepID=UPI00074D5410|nr:conjugal transfer protein [Listeria monocytogenes]EAE3023560.1 conjugal transfer protein [Listeria monocytogenes]EAE4087990.1 conjugal transfer protein [Listeria monocytogenes]EAE4593945.1 conjugal transfer protein [Listeria monocytogenes]EAF1315050.1 conjugal transfer protein [Listeria monocytogenes]EDN9477244.1 conjugal transfer protein [Listeria monocytogenes]